MKTKLPDTRTGVTHRVVLHVDPPTCPHCHKPTTDGKVKVFVTANTYPDGRVAEIFVCADSAGSTFDGFADCWAIAVSLALQAGVPLEKVIEKFSYQDFQPKGMTDNPDLRTARSVVDYIVRWLEATFLKPSRLDGTLKPKPPQ